MKNITITREQAKANNMPRRHRFGVISENCIGYWGTGGDMLSATIYARQHCPDAELGGCWMECVRT